MLRALAPAALLLAALAAPASAADGDRDAARRIVDQLAKQPPDARLAKEPIEKAEHALRRAGDARATGDHVHAAELDALAREWAETAADLVRAARAEDELAATQKQLTETETRLVRARALLEETVARRGRARQTLEKLEAERAGKGQPAPSGGKP